MPGHGFEYITVVEAFVALFELNSSDIPLANRINFGAALDSSRKLYCCFLGIEVLLLHREKQEIDKILFGVKPESVIEHELLIGKH